MTPLAILVASTLVASTLGASTLLASPQDAPKTAAPAAPAAPAAQAATALSIGDPAPALRYDAWVKGAEIDRIAPGKVHVVEFWATWCGPCIAVMPHLTELQKRHPEVVVVSVAASERGKDEAAKLSKVREFVEDKGDVMGYRVVYAGDPAKMSEPWMRAAGQSGIPCAFIVDGESKVAWIGHPGEMDGPLEQVLAGRWDLDAARKAFDAEQAGMLAMREISMAMRAARASGDYAPVVARIKSELERAPSDRLKLQLVNVLAGPAAQPAEAWRYGEEVYESGRADASLMNALAWMIVDPEGDVQEPNLDLALRAAEAAAAASDHSDGAILDTLARVHFRKGDVARAIELQRKAIEKAPEGPMRESMKAALVEYQGALRKA